MEVIKAILNCRAYIYSQNDCLSYVEEVLVVVVVLTSSLEKQNETKSFLSGCLVFNVTDTVYKLSCSNSPISAAFHCHSLSTGDSRFAAIKRIFIITYMRFLTISDSMIN